MPYLIEEPEPFVAEMDFARPVYSAVWNGKPTQFEIDIATISGHMDRSDIR